VGRAQATLAGRLIVGPVVEIAGFLIGEADRLRDDAPDARRDWAGHVLASAAVLAWLHFVCQLNLATYLLAFVLPGAALTLVRSFAEHRADGRVAVVERAPLFGLLFLNNNLHAAHHAWPGLPWWRLPTRYRQHREALLAANGGLVYAGYGEVFRRFLFRPHDVLLHPRPRLEPGA
jgi:fatty acid desaturase